MLVITIVWVIFGVVNLIRVGMVVYIAPALAEYPTSLSLGLLGTAYGLWSVVFLVAAIIAWRRKSTGGAFGLALAYQAVLWMLNVLGYRSEYARSLWPRDLFSTLIFLVLIALLARRDGLFKNEVNFSTD